jgi:hypothetical protein
VLLEASNSQKWEIEKKADLCIWFSAFSQNIWDWLKIWFNQIWLILLVKNHHYIYVFLPTKALLIPKNNYEEKHCSKSTIVATMTKSKTTICKLQTTSPSRQGFEKKPLYPSVS